MEDIPALPSLRFPWKKVLATIIAIVLGITSIVGTTIALTKDNEISNITRAKRRQRLKKDIEILRRQTQIYTGSLAGRQAQLRDIQKYYDGKIRDKYNFSEIVKKLLEQEPKEK